MSTKLTAHDVRRIAVEAKRDPRTVRNVLEGRPSKDLSREDVLEAAARLGINPTKEPSAA